MSFKIPLQTEVLKYITEKKGGEWPPVYISHISERFYNNYMASGWKLSNGNPIKDWKACFNAQWQTPKFKEDIEFLERCKKENSYISGRLQEGVDDKTLVAWYDWAKSNPAIIKQLTLPRDTIERIRVEAGNNNDKGKVLCMRELIRLGKIGVK